MTKERFMELAKREGIAEERAENIWKGRPDDFGEISEEQMVELFQLSCTGFSQQLYEMMVHARKIYDAHVAAVRN